MKKSELLAFRQHPILPITLEVKPGTTVDLYAVSISVCGIEVLENEAAGDSPDEAADSVWGSLADSFARTIWDVIPDTFTWSARLKRAMAHLVSLAPSWETLEGWGMTKYTFNAFKDYRRNTLDVPALDELECYDVELLPDEEPTYTEAQKQYVHAYHIIQSVLGFDWATADDQTLRRHPSWLLMEPEAALPNLWEQEPLTHHSF